jgi:hypothetical protein
MAAIVNTAINTLTTLAGMSLTDLTNNDMFGSAIAGIGDYNLDGYKDIVSCMPGFYSGKGKCIVVLGNRTSSLVNMEADSFVSGASGF